MIVIASGIIVVSTTGIQIIRFTAIFIKLLVDAVPVRSVTNHCGMTVILAYLGGNSRCRMVMIALIYVDMSSGIIEWGRGLAPNMLSTGADAKIYPIEGDSPDGRPEAAPALYPQN